MAMRNKHKEKRLAQEKSATEGLRLRSADRKGRTGRLRGWSDSEEGQAELKPKRKKRRGVTTAMEHDLEEGGHFHVSATHLGQPGTYEEEPVKVRRKQASEQPKEKKKKKATCDMENQAEVTEVRKVKGAKAAKEEKSKDKKEKKKRRKDHSDFPEAYGMMGHAMMAPMMGMMRPMSYPMMPGMMMMPGGIIGAPLMGGVGPMGMHGAPTMPYSLPGVPIVRPIPKASSKAEEKRRRFTEAPAPAPEPAEPEPEAEAEATEPAPEEPEKRSASVSSSSSSSSSTSEAKNEGPPSVPVEVTAPLAAQTLGEGELELGLISPEPDGKEEHSPLQVPPGMESPVASQSPDMAETSRLNKPSSWVEVEGETMEELQRELEVTCQNKPCVSIGTQTEMEEPTAEELSEDLADRWFLGFVDAVPMPGNKESSDSSDSSDEAEEDGTCRPERQLRQRSRSQSQGPAAKSNAEAAEASSSSSSSSSSSGGSRKRQRAPSSDEEAAKATQSLAPQMPPVDPRRLRMVQDYSDVA